MFYKSALAVLAAAGVFAGPALTQSIVDVSSLRAIDDIDVHDVEGNEIGEVEEILIDQTGMPVAVVVELGGILGIGDEDVVISLEQMTYANGVYQTTLTEAETEGLPRYDD